MLIPTSESGGLSRGRQRTKTVFVISHRINSLATCDRIFVLEDGEITAWGTHRELASREGLYRRIMEIQSADRDMVLEDVEKAHQEGGLA